VGLGRLLIKILSVEWMAVFVGLAVVDTPPVVPVLLTEGLLSLDFANLRVDEGLWLIERPSRIDFHLLNRRQVTIVHRIVPPC